MRSRIANSHVERWLAAALILAVAAPAAAEIGPPIQLIPQAPANRTAPAPPSVAPAVPSTSDSGGAAGISAQPLAPVDPSWIGTLGAADHAFPGSLWADTPRSLVAAALPLLQPTSSPSLQSLARRLLLSDAVAPAGSDPEAGPSLVTLRLDRLLALGRSDAAALTDSLAPTFINEAVDRDAVELKIAAGDRAGACKIVSDRVARYANAWWSRAVVACQALSGDYDQAALGLSALRDQKSIRDPAFEALIEGVMGHRPTLEKLSYPTPLSMALLAAAKLPLPADALGTANPAALAVYATSDKPPLSDRLAAAERAAALGALPPAGLGLIYAAVDFTPEERAAALNPGAVPDTPRRRAILYDIARTSEPGAARMAALAPFLAEARNRGGFVLAARIVAPLVIEIRPLPDQQSIAGDAARVLLAAHEFDAAAPWITLADQPELRFIASLAGEAKAETSAPSFAAIVAALKARNAALAPRQAALLLGLAEGLGQPVDDGLAAALLQPPHQGVLPDGVVWYAQQQAAKAERLGETVLMTLLLAQAGERLSAEPVVLAQAIAGLGAVGLDDDARALALEAALDAGV
jgi:hypothetical protein